MKSYTDFTAVVKGAMRKRALNIPRFAETREGCIRILCISQSQEAHEWTGGKGEYNPNDISYVEDAYAIAPGGSFIARFKNEDGSVDTVNTYAMTAMKIAQLLYAWEKDHEMLSGRPDAGLEPENGFAPWRGALCCEVNFDFRQPGCCYGAMTTAPFCLIFIAVSGATEEEDERVAAAAIPAIEEFFRNEKQVISPIVGDATD